MFNSQDLINLFNNLFASSEKTILVGNGAEPLYLPRDENFSLSRIIFTKDYFSSALHEIAHWCIAGEKRRALVDYGYWYNPDGRNAEQQDIFEQAEVKPQALEWIFSLSAGSKFIVSVDNLTSDQTKSSETFEKNILHQVQQYLTAGLPKRADLFNKQLRLFYKK